MALNKTLLATMEQTGDLWFKENELKILIEELKSERKTLDLDSDRAFELKATIKDTQNELESVLKQSDKTLNQLQKIANRTPENEWNTHLNEVIKGKENRGLEEILGFFNFN